MALNKLFLVLATVCPFTINGSEKNISSFSKEKVHVVRNDCQTVNQNNLPIKYHKGTDVRIQSSISERELNVHFKGVLRGKGKTFLQVQRVYGVSATFLAGIAIHESGNGSSKMAKDRNNVFGLKGKKFKNVEDCIWYTAKLLAESKYYFKSGKVTISKIQKTYAPDREAINRNWAKSICLIANKLERTIT